MVFKLNEEEVEMYYIHGEKTNTTYAIDFDVEIGQTGANKINNFELFLLNQTFTPLIPAAFGNNWGSNITVNSSTSVVGTFHGELANASQTSVQDLLSGVVNINFMIIPIKRNKNPKPFFRVAFFIKYI